LTPTAVGFTRAGARPERDPDFASFLDFSTFKVSSSKTIDLPNMQMMRRLGALLRTEKTAAIGRLGKEASAMRLRSLELESLEDRTVPATFTVTSLADSGLGTLRDAVNQANVAAGADVVVFAPGLTGTITLTSGELDVDDSVIIEGPGADLLTVSGNDQYRVFYIAGPADERIDVTISDMTLANGNGSATPFGLTDGGAILALFDHSLTIEDAIIRDSVGSSGGGVASRGIDNDLTIRRSQILNNESVGLLSNGGGVSASGRSFEFRDSTADGNVSSYSGGGLSIQTDTGLVFGSTISNNIASDGGGGGIETGLINSTIITNSTIADNQANGGFSGGGILAFDVMAINNSTIVRNIENSEGGSAGIEAFLGSSVTLLSSLVAENEVPGNPVFWATDVGGDVTSLGNNLIGDTKGSDGSIWLASDILDRPSNLPELADNGGLTKTILPEGASFANGNGANPLGLPFDQRGTGFPRGSDIGAVSGGRARVSPGSPGADDVSGARIKLLNLADDSTVGYIRALYFTILGRDADEVGLKAYSQILQRGGSREEVAYSIWTSGEHRQQQVAGYYRTFLDRTGEQGEIDSWAQTMVDGASEEEVIAAILSSDEYRNRFATPQLYVVQLYRDLLDRAPLADELAVKTSSLNGGESPKSVVESIVESVEYQNRQLTALYEQLLLRPAGHFEIGSYQGRFADSVRLTDLAVEIAASDEMFSVGQLFIPIA
jgi:hypothetical protein